MIIVFTNKSQQRTYAVVEEGLPTSEIKISSMIRIDNCFYYIDDFYLAIDKGAYPKLIVIVHKAP